jgi:preprotein translocase subunit SecY
VIQTVRKAWAIPELQKKIIFTCFMLLLFRLGNAIPVPYVDADALAESIASMGTTVLGLYNVMSGGAFAMATLFALGVQPYINASIIIQLLTIAIPALERIAKEGGEEGRKKIASITRYTTVGIALLQGFGYYMLMKNWGILTNEGIWAALVIIVSFMAGSSLVMWMGEQITEFGIGNGISVILFAGIISRIPAAVSNMAEGVKLWSAERAGEISAEMMVEAGYTEETAQSYMDQAISPWGIALLLVGVLALVVLITFVNGAERRIPVQYAKRQVGRRMYGGQSSTLPMKVNMSGVLPIIFAQSIAMLPATIMAFTGVGPEGSFSYGLSQFIDTQSVLYMIVYFLMIIGFSYFYATIQFNPIEISNNLKKQGGFIPGFRPGKPTSDFIARVLKNVTLFGAIYLGIVALCPLLLGKVISNASLSIGGTSVIIVVGVVLETVRSLENQMMMRQYKGFLE